MNHLKSIKILLFFFLEIDNTVAERLTGEFHFQHGCPMLLLYTGQTGLVSLGRQPV